MSPMQRLVQNIWKSRVVHGAATRGSGPSIWNEHWTQVYYKQIKANEFTGMAESLNSLKVQLTEGWYIPNPSVLISTNFNFNF